MISGNDCTIGAPFAPGASCDITLDSGAS